MLSRFPRLLGLLPGAKPSACAPHALNGHGHR